MEQKDAYSLKELYRYASKVSNVMGCLLIVLIYFMGKHFFNYKIGLLASFLASIEFNLWCCSQKVWMETTAALFFWLTFYLLVLATKNKYYFYLAALSGAAAMLTKYPVILLYFIFFIYALFHERHIFKRKEIYLSLLISVSLFLPWLFYNMHYYGSDALNMMIFHGGGYSQRINLFLRYMAITAVAVILIFFLFTRENSIFKNLTRHISQMRYVFHEIEHI